MESSYRIRGVADIEEIEKVPLERRIKEQNTFEILENGSALNPDGIAITFLPSGDISTKAVQVTYRDFVKRVRQTANMLHAFGVGRGDVVTYVLPNLLQTHFILWGSEAVGIANPVNPLLEAAAIRDICIAAGTKVLVALGESPDCDIWRKIESIQDAIPSLTHLVRVMGPSDEKNRIWGFDEIIDQYEGEHLVFDKAANPQDIASIYHTGGTTGRPKLARRSHGNEIAFTGCLKLSMGLRSGNTTLVGLPLFHANATMISGLLPFSIGGHVVILGPSGFRDPAVIQNFYETVDHYKPVYFSCVPTVLSSLLTIPHGEADLSSLQYVACGAAPLSVALFTRFEAYTGIKIQEGYGLTESTVASSFNPLHGEAKIGSIGIRLPYQLMKIAIVDSDGRYIRDAITNEVGVVCIKGPCVFKGYVEQHHNKEIWLDDGWFNSGDLGRQDADSYFWLVGRQKDLIIRGGHNIDPVGIEEQIYKMDGVTMVAAVGRPDAHAGEVPVAYVQTDVNANITNEDVMQWAKDHIAERSAIPKEIVIVDQMPLTSVGKIFKSALRWAAAKDVFCNELKALDAFSTVENIVVGEDKLQGTRVDISLKAREQVDPEELKKRVSDIMATYPLHYTITVT